MNLQERKNRIIARGEFSNHAHVITGDAKIHRNLKGELLVEMGSEECILKHILESEWMKGNEIWTEEHHDINISEYNDLVPIGEILGRHGDIALEKIRENTYKVIQQKVFDPLTQRIKDAID